MRLESVSLIVLSATLAACATAPAPLRGEFASQSPAMPARDGDAVRWGGEVIQVTTEANRSCFEILARDLNDSARPRQRDESAGRFLACRKGFYDPEVFAKGREVTVTGVLSGMEERLVGEFRYRYPKVEADVIYLWRKPVETVRVYDPYPWFYWDPFWHRHYVPPVVIVRDRHPHPRPPKPVR
ncbi:Slp family lipoprotein [Tahibacter amnicola]|uniref:Slp family lipoprotein n=1 Tax=Tahibacter amnicola TaxID=2976241 RepID=A0ABY6BJJ6_9GAMM|nr:Slp family lipoprotein [Tahibacter amnicola]UXI69637.1 Slp family lipoprotein [Tahibacter amnicola]